MRRRLLTLLAPVLLLAGGCQPVQLPGPVTLPPPPVEPAEPVEQALPEEPPPAPAELLPLPPAVAREFRGAWVTPLWGGEWPSRPGLSTEAQQAELVRLFDRAGAIGLNAVVLHVRPAADALYATSRAPWSVYLSGVQGQAPGPWYDPLEFAIAEAHRRGLELHAWFNPFRASPPDRRVAASPEHVTRRHPEWVVTYAGQRWIDPGIPAARAEVLQDILEVVERYDVDGIHLDDYFYPYVEQRSVRRQVRSGGRTRTVTVRENIPFPDDASWRRWGEPAGFGARGDWRRANIDTFIAALYGEVKARKPWVAVGISPFGIWQSGVPAGVTGLDAYREIYADARRWLREGWLDYVAPQLYWPIAGVQQRFTRLDAWWREQNVQQRHIWPGLHTAQEVTARSGYTSGEVAREIEVLRSARAGTAEAQGHIHFRLASLLSPRAGIGAGLQATTYRDAVLPPPYPWLDATRPAAPVARLLNDTIEVSASDSVAVKWWLLQVQDAASIWHSSIYPGTMLRLPLPPLPGAEAAAVTAISRTGIESPPALLRLRVIAD